MQIDLNDLGKHYNNKWVFNKLTCSIEPGSRYAIIGNNGSGKSTLIKILAGLESSDSGTLEYNNSSEGITTKQVSLCAPYTQAILEFSALENLAFAHQFKLFKNGMSIQNIFDLIPIEKRSKTKPLKQLSSGMVQRVKLLLTLLSDVPLILLDEPLNNLDEEGYKWYNELIKEYIGDSTLIIASNNREEYLHCDSYIRMGDLPLRHGKIQDLS